jgi:TonB family protein
MPLPTGRELMQQSVEMARLAAEIDRRQELMAKRPKRKFISASTQEYEYASYMRAWVQKVERVGNLNYPEQARRQGLGGRLIMTVSVGRDGDVKGVLINTSSGKKPLDDAAVKVVQLASPFAPLPKTDEEVDIRDHPPDFKNGRWKAADQRARTACSTAMHGDAVADLIAITDCGPRRLRRNFHAAVHRPGCSTIASGARGASGRRSIRSRKYCSSEGTSPPPSAALQAQHRTTSTSNCASSRPGGATMQDICVRSNEAGAQTRISAPSVRNACRSERHLGMADVADDRNFSRENPALALAHGQHVQQAPGRVRAVAVAGVDETVPDLAPRPTPPPCHCVWRTMKQSTPIASDSSWCRARSRPSGRGSTSKPSVSAPSRTAANWKELRVRVDGSKNSVQTSGRQPGAQSVAAERIGAQSVGRVEQGHQRRRRQPSSVSRCRSRHPDAAGTRRHGSCLVQSRASAMRDSGSVNQRSRMITAASASSFEAWWRLRAPLARPAAKR